MEGPVRMCLACRERRAQDALLRLAVQDGTVTVVQPARPAARRAGSPPDARPPGSPAGDVARPAHRRTGRGAYLCPRQGCAEAALRKDAAAVLRALRLRRGDVTVDADAVRAAGRPAAAGNDKSEQEAAATAAGRRTVAARGACT